MKKIKINKKKGILFWITGLSGTGKTSIGRNIKKDIVKNYGPTLVVSGDDIRNAFNLNKYDKISRLKIGKQYTRFCKILTNQNINIIFSVVGLFHELQKYNRLSIKNYVEIYIKADLFKVKKISKKKHYNKKTSNVLGLDIKPEIPKNPHIIIKNDFKNSKSVISKNLFKIIKKKLIY